MRIPDDRPPGLPLPRGGRQHDRDAGPRYLSPGAFTVLPPDEMHHDPPAAPQPYRLTPTSRRHKEQAFSIIAEPSSNPTSRSPSPTGRVSPFRGRGFNPAGSRHASPAPSPPPHEERKIFPKNRQPPNSTRSSPKKSQIPQLQRRGSASLFGESVSHSPTRNLSPKLSKSLTNLPPKKVSYRPPPSPKRTKAPAFQQLSPITGSSPEPDQAQSQSSKFPRNRSQPPSRHDSPAKKLPHHTPRSPSKNNSRSTSREQSPSKPLMSPTKNNYKHVQAKVNSYNKLKPKVPPKPQDVLNSTNETRNNNSVSNSREDVTKNKNSQRAQLSRKDSVNRFNNNTPRSTAKTNDNNMNGSNKNISSSTMSLNKNNNGSVNNSTSKIVNGSEGSPAKLVKNDAKSNSKSTLASSSITKLNESNSALNETAMRKGDGSVTTASSKETVNKGSPTKSKRTEAGPIEKNDKIGPIVDGRVLSATSVSNAINKMNDTVLDTNTLMKDHNFSKLSPAASTIISMSKTADDIKDGVIEKQHIGNEDRGKENLTSTGHAPLSNNVHVLDSSRTGNFANNINKFSTEHKLGSLNSLGPKTLNDRILDARTVVAADVQPLRITVKEKPVNVEVQSGNVRMNTTANGMVNEAPGLPPPQPPQNEAQQNQEPTKTNPCSRFFANCKRKVPCACCKKQTKSEEAQRTAQVKSDEEEKKVGCFGCRKGRKELPEDRVSLAQTQESQKKGCLDRLKCCGKNKVSDKTTTGCCPRKSFKDKWARSDSILSESPPSRKCSCSKAACRNFFRQMFCINSCCKKEDPISRRESVLSKKKSLTSTAVPTPEDTGPKLDLSLVEHTSHMKAAIPVLPIKLAWFCLICNVIVPGSGTVFSGLICLCIGKPRFSQKDGPKQRIGAFIIDLIIGCGQLFTVLFCLVGWGWSIWWGVIMLKLARKQQKIKLTERSNSLEERQAPPVVHHRDIERGL